MRRKNLVWDSIPNGTVPAVFSISPRGQASLDRGRWLMDYIVYTFGHNGHIIARQDVMFENDEDAVAAAKRLLPAPLGGRLEVWEHARLVATIPS